MHSLKRLLVLPWFTFFALGCSVSATAEDWTFIEDISGSPQGGVVLRYPDAAEARAQFIAHQLRHHGWSSLLVPIPLIAAEPSPPVNSELPITHIKEQHGQLNLVLLTLGDAWDDSLNLSEFENADGNIERPIQAVVLIDVPGEFSATPNVPTLDISTTPNPVFGYEQRQQIARKDNIESNQGIQIRYSTRRPAAHRDPSHQADFLTRRIRSWLHHNAQGMEITSIAP